MAPADTRSAEQAKKAQQANQPGVDSAAIQELRDQVQGMQASINQLAAMMKGLLAARGPPVEPATNAPIKAPPERFRADEIGFFDDSGDPYLYAARLREVALAKENPRYVLNNLSVLLTGQAFNWLMYELADGHRLLLTNQQSVEPFCEALIDRFAKQRSQLLEELRATRYTHQDAEWYACLQVCIKAIWACKGWIDTWPFEWRFGHGEDAIFLLFGGNCYDCRHRSDHVIQP